MSTPEIRRHWSIGWGRLVDGALMTLVAAVPHQAAAGRASALAWVLAAYFMIFYLPERPGSFRGLVAAFDPTARTGDRAVRAATEAGWLVVRTLQNRGGFVIAAAQGGRIAARPFAAHVHIRVPEHVGPLARLPLFPYLPPRLRSLPRDWWNAPDLAWKLSLVAALELVFNVVLIDAGQFDGVLILRDLFAMAGLVGFAQFYYYARVDMVLRKLEREQAAEEARAMREGCG